MDYYNPEDDREQLIIWGKIMDLPYDRVEDVKEDFNKEFDKRLEISRDDYDDFTLPDKLV